MNKSLFEEIEQTNATRTRPFSQGPGGCRAAMMRRNYYALETSSIKESFDSDVFSLYDDHKYDAVEKPKSHFTFNALSIDEQYLNADDPQLPPAEMKRISITSSKDQSSEREDSFDSVIGNFKSFEENPIITNDYNKISDMLKKYRESNEERLLCHRNSIEQLRQVQSKVKEIDDLDYNVNSLIFRAVEVHTDLLVSLLWENNGQVPLDLLPVGGK